MIVTLPNWSNDVTAVVSLINADSKEIFKSSSLNRDEEYDITLARNECILLGDGGEKMKVTLSGVPGGTGGTAKVTMYVEK